MFADDVADSIRALVALVRKVAVLGGRVTTQRIFYEIVKGLSEIAIVVVECATADS